MPRLDCWRERFSDSRDQSPAGAGPLAINAIERRGESRRRMDKADLPARDAHSRALRSGGSSQMEKEMHEVSITRSTAGRSLRKAI